MEKYLSSKEVYNILVSNNEILNIYTEIEKREVRECDWAFHNIEHVKNVSKIAEKILNDLNFDEEIIYDCKIACLLHDVGALEGKEGHALRSYEYAKKLFKEKKLFFKDSELVLDAIKNHSAGFETENVVTLSIILADKLDITKKRITKEGIKVIGNRQYFHIEDVMINIAEKKMTINFLTDGNMDIKETNEYYFTKKVFKAVEAFSNKLKLKYNILLDNEKWDLE